MSSDTYTFVFKVFMLFKALQDNKFKKDIDKMVLMGRTVDFIFNYLVKQKESVKREVVNDYVINWCKVKLVDAYNDYLWLCKNIESWTMVEFSEEEILSSTEVANNFRRELLIARTEYRIQELYRNTVGVDERTYKELTSLQLTAMAHQDKINQKNANSTSGIITTSTDLDSEDDTVVNAIDVSDLEKYLYKKSPGEKQTIRDFLSDLVSGKAIKLVDLDEYKKK